jgi:hypothetical protein
VWVSSSSITYDHYIITVLPYVFIAMVCLRHTCII